jgi:two-component system OmpR family response regulator
MGEPRRASVAISKVMLVDDDEDLRMIGRIALVDVGGLSVVIARGGEEALQLAESEQPDVILLDVMMPGMNGATTLARLHENEATASIPVIFMTARAYEEDIEHYMRLGAVGVIVKPFDPMGLAEQVRRILSAARGAEPGA